MKLRILQAFCEEVHGCCSPTATKLDAPRARGKGGASEHALPASQKRALKQFLFRTSKNFEGLRSLRTCWASTEAPHELFFLWATTVLLCLSFRIALTCLRSKDSQLSSCPSSVACTSSKRNVPIGLRGSVDLLKAGGHIEGSAQRYSSRRQSQVKRFHGQCRLRRCRCLRCLCR